MAPAAVAFSADGQVIARPYGRHLRFWNISTGRNWTSVADELYDTSAIVFAPDGKWIAIQGYFFGRWEAYTSFRLLEAATGKLARTFIENSTDYPYGPEDLLSDETCMHQRLLAYQWNGDQAVEIANVAGCVTQEDLYGVRLEDYDHDGQLEIQAAHNGQLRNRAYKWTGSKFVLWGDIPGN